MLDSCRKHPHERGVALCGRCGESWCGDCLVYAFGPKKPPFCLSCAMVAAGVRSSAPLPAMPRKQLKAQMKAFKAHAKASDAPAEPVPAAPAEPQTDWASPWWEDRQEPALAD